MKIVFLVPIIVVAAHTPSVQLAQRLPARLILDDERSVASDGKGTYIDGKDGVEAYVGGPDASFYLRFASSSSRAFSVALTKPADATNTPRRGIVRCGASKSSEIIVHDLLSIPVGTTASRPGHIQLEIEYIAGKASKGYDLSFNGHEPDPVANFSVKRVSASQWIVENSNTTDGVGSLRWAALPPDYPRSAWTFLGHAHFHTPLRMTITMTPGRPNLGLQPTAASELIRAAAAEAGR